MKVTEHNITDWKLTDTEINELIRLVKTKMQTNSESKDLELFYGLIIGKLIIMKND